MIMRVSVNSEVHYSKVRGFALVIALSVMAFILVAILLLVSSVAIEQYNSSIKLQIVAARQNALLALHSAIGELQLRLGPDQRATASADILNQLNKPYTLVWHSNSGMGWDPVLQDWDADSGSILNHARPLVSASRASLDRLITVDGEFDESVFTSPVGLLSVNSPVTGILTTLVADKLNLTDANSTRIGRYAWVVQDESLKANLATEDSAQVATDELGVPIDADHSMALVETSRRLSVFPSANPAALIFNENLPFGSLKVGDAAQAATRSKATHLADWISGGLLDSGDAHLQSAERQVAPYRNHFTFYSRGVLADAKNGGLRRDLSRGLDDQYFQKLHNVPVFGADRYGSVIADGISQPVGDQWKILRDYYQFYRPVDNGLAGSLSDSRNTFHGLSDVTSANPSVRIRLTHEDIARGLNGIYSSGKYTNETPPYSTLITPKTPTPLSSPAWDTSIGANDWFLLTPQIRPVVLQNTLKIGLYFEKITEESHAHFGKYRMAMAAYPVLTLWNPFNVAIDLSPSISPNPMGNADALKLYQNGNFELHLKVNNESEVLRFPIDNIAPNLQLNAATPGVPSKMPAGAVWVLGMTQSHDSDISDNQYINLALVSASTVSPSNRIIKRGYYKYEKIKKDLVRADRFFEASDRITLLDVNNPIHNEYRWFGKFRSGTVDHYCFNTGENSDLPKPLYVSDGQFLGVIDQSLNNLAVLSKPLVTINFSANTIDHQWNNPAFPVFAQVNFLGANPQVVADQDTEGDVKALYIREHYNADSSDFSDIFPEHNNGLGYFGKSFDSSDGVNRITLYDLPRHPIISIADLKNLTLGWCEDTHARPIGASWPLATISDLSDPYIRSVEPNGYGTSSHSDRQSQYLNGAGCDTSYYYNEALFDTYFFSGIPSAERDGNVSLRDQTFPFGREFNQEYIDGNERPANTRLIYYGHPTVADLRGLAPSANRMTDDGYEKSAAYLMIDGPFNINSTSPQAWQSILSGFRGLEIVGVDDDYSGKETYDAPGSAFVDNFVPSGDEKDLYTGHRRLSDLELGTFSEQLVEEIRNRGIAKTLGAFVNRDLSGRGDDQKMSRLDEAIRTSGLNHSPDTTMDDRYASNHLDRGGHLFGANLIEESAAGLPGYFKQQDVLRPLSPIMTTRGDTFLLRCYGESIDPTTGATIGKAVCEAIVQRVPDYVDETVDPWAPAIGRENEKFGRKLKIIRFRWLSNNDLS